jgi:hypothetical protein
LGDHQQGHAMTDLTPRQILDAIREALEETGRRYAREKGGQTPEPSQPKPSTDVAAERDPGNRPQ